MTYKALSGSAYLRNSSAFASSRMEWSARGNAAWVELEGAGSRQVLGSAVDPPTHPPLQNWKSRDLPAELATAARGVRRTLTQGFF